MTSPPSSARACCSGISARMALPPVDLRMDCTLPGTVVARIISRLSARSRYTTCVPCGTTSVTVDVRNDGAREGDEVVQLYIHDKVSSVTRPIKELKGFERVSLKPGEVRTVRFTITPESLQMWNDKMHRVVEPGEFEIMTGNSSVALQSTTLTVTP